MKEKQRDVNETTNCMAEEDCLLEEEEQESNDADQMFENEDLAQDEIDSEEDFQINEAVEEIIVRHNKLVAECKANILESILVFINEACEQNGWEYIAVGKLLTYQDEEEDAYPESCIYELRMMRKDYDAFTEYAKNNASKYGLRINKVYNNDMLVKHLTFSIKKAEKIVIEDETIDSSIEIKIIPYDVVPLDKEAEKQQKKEVLELNRQYKSDSRYIFSHFTGKKKRTFWEKIENKLERTVKYSNNHFKNYHKRLYQAATKYNDQDTGCYRRYEMLVRERIEYKEDIFPIAKKDFLGTTLMVPANIKEYKVPEIKKYVNHVKSIQTRALKRFNDFCDKNGLTYFAMTSLLIECVQNSAYDPENKKNWKVGLLRKDYDKAIELLSNPATSEGLVLKKYQDEYPNIPRKEIGFICEEDSRPDMRGKNCQVLMEAFDNVPSSMKKRVALTKQIKQLNAECKEMVLYERGFGRKKPEMTIEEKYAEIHSLAQSFKKPTKKVARFATGYGDNIAVSELLPVHKKAFRGFEISVPATEYLWYDKEDESFSEALTEAKTELLKVFDELCQKEDIEYFAVASLLIGTIVYQDVIPNGGNRQMALGLVRDQYDKLINILRTRGSEWNLYLKEYRDVQKRYPQCTKSISFEGKELSRVILHILPFDKVPESFYLRRSFRQKMRELNKQYNELVDYKLGMKNFSEKKAKMYEDLNPIEFADEIDTFAQKYNDDPQAYSYERISLGFSKIIDEEDLYPICRKKFRDMTVPCPKDYSAWQPVQDKNLEFQVQCIQEADRKIIKEFDRVCQKLGIGYFICGGTMLGYMRHKGFIPWDDDVDVAMLRADYDRFLAEAGSEFGEEYFLQTRESDPNIPYLFTKVRLKNTEYITEYNKDRDFQKGLCLDVFPFDYLPNNMKERKKFINSVMKLSKEHNKIANGQLPEVEEPFKPRTEEEAELIQIEKDAIKKYWETSMVDTQKAYIEKATMYNDRAEELGLKTVASFVPTFTYVDIQDLLPYQRGMFEGIEVSVPKRPDIFLEMQYGDYMELPPLHSRVAHRLLRWSDGVHGADNIKKRNYEKRSSSIYDVTDISFQKYGRVLSGYDCSELMETMKNIPTSDEVCYEPSVAVLEKLPISQEFQNRAFGGLPIEVGYCKGKNNTLNALEYHRSSEINVAVTDCILQLGCLQDVTEQHTYDTSKIESFIVPAGTVIELFATTLHYVPCGMNDGNFETVVVLPKGTNTELPASLSESVKTEEKDSQGKDDANLLYANNKWLIAHPDAKIAGAFCGLQGDNLSIKR